MGRRQRAVAQCPGLLVQLEPRSLELFDYLLVELGTALSLDQRQFARRNRWV
jgi:hypothetical protein